MSSTAPYAAFNTLVNPEKTFNERLGGHLANIRQGNNYKPVSQHFTSSNHTSDNVTTILVIQTHNNVKFSMRTGNFDQHLTLIL